MSEENPIMTPEEHQMFLRISDRAMQIEILCELRHINKNLELIYQNMPTEPIELREAR